MTITPDQAQELRDGISNTPWRAIKSDFKIDPTGIVRDAEDETIGAAEGGHVDPDFTHGQANLIAAAPDMAETIAGMKFEYAVEMYHDVDDSWKQYTTWVATREGASRHLTADAGDGRQYRLVRRLVSSPEVVDGE